MEPTRFTEGLRPAGTATLTCYTLPYVWCPLQQMLGGYYPEALNAGIPGLLWSVVFSLVIVGITGVLVRAKIKLKV